MDSNFKNSEAVIVKYTHIPLIFTVFFWSFDIFVYFSPRFIHFYTGDGRKKKMVQNDSYLLYMLSISINSNIWFRNKKINEICNFGGVKSQKDFEITRRRLGFKCKIQ